MTHSNLIDMKVLVLNCGSSSIKYKLFDMDHKLPKEASRKSV